MTDFATDGQTVGGRGAGGVHDVEGAQAGQEAKILDQFPVARNGLGADAGAAGGGVFFAQIGHQAL